MPSFILVGQGDGNKIYQVGRIGYDTNPSGTDTGDKAYTANLETERMSPAGEDALIRIRRVVLRALASKTWTVTMRVYVDDVQTQIWDNDETSATFGTQIDQEIVVSSEAMADASEGEVIIEADVDATGTFLQVHIDILSSDITGYFLPESIETHLQVLRESKSRSTLDVSSAPWSE